MADIPAQQRLSSIKVTNSVAGLVRNAGGPTRPAPEFVQYETYDPTAVRGAIKNNSPDSAYESGDWRVRVSLPPNSKLFYNRSKEETGILEPLNETGGVIFPYTPQITMTYEAQYDSSSTMHSNYQNYFYKSSQINAIQITGEFTVQNETEGRYLLAAIHFFRAATRMFFGQSSFSDARVGNPPIIVLLKGYGKFYFPNVPCVMTSFAHTLPNDVDYMSISPEAYSAAKHKTRLPTTSSITISLNPVYSRSNIFNNYDLNSIANGERLSYGSNFL